MDTQTLDTFRRKLIRRGQSLIGGEHPTPAEEREPPRSNHPGWGWKESDDEPTAAEIRIRTRETEATALIRIQASLARIAQGTFGDCIICHAPIETERLRAIPEVDRCGGCTR